MMDATANRFENIAKQLGASIKIPRPSKTMKNLSALTNGLVGISCIMLGVTLKKHPLTLLGTLAIVGAVLLSWDE